MLSFDAKRPLLRTMQNIAPRWLLRGVCHLFGATAYLFNSDDIRTEVLPLIRKALACGDLEAHKVGIGATIESLITYLDVLCLMADSPENIKRRMAKSSVVEGLDHLRKALATGRGAILFSAHFGCMYFSTLHELADSDTIFSSNLCFLMRGGDGLDTVISKIRETAKRPIDIIDIDNPYAAKEIIARLRKNDVIACMFDFFYEGTSLIVGDFLGKPTATPGGLPRIIAHTGTSVLPQFTFREKDAFRTRIDKALDLPIDGSLDERTVLIADLMNRAIEAEILVKPSEWTFWRGLERRWKWGKLVTTGGTS